MRTTYAAVLIAATVALLAASAPLRADQTDKRIESSAKKTYVFKTYLKDDSIKIDAKDGVVTLTGTVTDSSHKSLAQDTVEGLPGVQRVDNQLVIKGSDGAENSDPWLATKVRTALLFHRSVSLRKTDVTVADGIVTLRGVADNQAEKDLATEYAKDIDGIKDVHNEMTLADNTEKPGQTFGGKVDDASVTAQVKATLLVHRSTSALKTKVETKDGIVTLTGTARNTAEKDLVSKLVNDINGVKGIKNEMTVEVAGA